MTRKHYLLVNAALITLFFCWPNNLMADDLTVIINEIGAYEKSGHEWIEVLNLTDSPIDMTGWKFWENETNHKLTLFAGDDTIIDPGEHAIVAQKADIFATDYPNVTSTIIDSAWSSLKESGEEIGLKDAEGNFVEVFTYAPAPDFSLQRIDPSLADYSESNWQEHVDSNTTGFANNTTSQPPEPEEEEPEEKPEPTPEPIDEEPDIIDTGPADTFLPSDIVINEIVSDPSSNEEEWIELYSNHTFPISLEGWVVEDGSERQIELTDYILPRQFYVIEELKFQLNNSGDIITLFDPNEKIIDKVTYGTWNDGNINDNAPKASDPQSLARKINGRDTDNDFNDFDITTTPTKGLNNLIIPPAESISPRSDVECQNEQKIIINEVFPNPDGSDSENEWIELKNTSDKKIDISGWKISDATKRKYIIEDTQIKSGDFIVFYRSQTKIALNNSGQEFVRLYNPDGCTVDEISYEGKVASDISYALSDTWQWTTNPTPKEKNIIISPNSDPIAVIDAPTEINVNDIVTFDASDSNDADGDELIYNWNLSDGTFSTSTTFDHIFNIADQYEVELIVTDILGGRDTAKMTINVLDIDNTFVDITPPPQPIDSNAIIMLSEFLANPVGSDSQEWIEIYNPTEWPIDLTGWQLDDSDGGSKPFILTDFTIESKQHLVFNRADTKLALNNSDDAVRLFDPAGNIVDQIDYEKIGEGNCLAIDNSLIWQETSQCSPNQHNVFEFVPNEKSNALTKTTLEELADFETGDSIIVEGTVTVEPGILGSQIFYVSGSGGLQIYMYKKDFPDMKVGDLIEVTGKLAESNGEQRLKISAKEDISVLSHNNGVEPIELSISDINDNLTGSLVKISGQVTEIKSSTVWLDDQTDEVQAYIKKGTGIKKEFSEGDFINLTGILSKSKNGLRILPRSQKDIVISKVLGESNIEDNLTTKQQINQTTKYLIAITIVLGIATITQSFKIKKLQK